MAPGISADIVPKLPQPMDAVMARRRRSRTSDVPVPEAPMNENSETASPVYHVGRARKASRVDSKANPEITQERPHYELWLGSRLANRGHASGPSGIHRRREASLSRLSLGSVSRGRCCRLKSASKLLHVKIGG